MFIRSLTLAHFRSYDSATLIFPERELEVFLGPNGSGKTNLIEAISMLSRGQSCLSSSAEEAIRWGGMFYRLTTLATKDSGENLSIEVVFQIEPTKQRAFFVDDIRSSLLRMRGLIPTVTFLPEDLTLFTGSPQGRRDFFDAFLEQLSAEFVRAKADHQRIIKQRNALLKRIASGDAAETDLDIWDTALADAGSIMQVKRSKLAQALSSDLSQRLGLLGEVWESVTLHYLRKTASDDPTIVASELTALLREYRRKEIASESTIVGPHRDDWRLDADGHDISTFASRGQQRASLLACLLQAMRTIEDYRSETPIILLDDVFSELDERHQAHLLSAVAGHQVFLTSTHLPPIAFESGYGLWHCAPGQTPVREWLNAPNNASASASAASSG